MHVLPCFLLFCGSINILLSSCSSQEVAISDFIQCTFLNVALQENGGQSSAIVNGVEKPCPRLNDGDIEDDSSDNDCNSNSIVKIDFARPYLIDTIRITHSENGAKSEWISVAFSDGSSEWKKFIPLSNGPEELSFTPRIVSWIKITVKSKYSDEVVRLTEVEVHNGACKDENVCDFLEFTDETMKSDRYVHGQVFSFLRKGKTGMSLKIANAQGQVKYWLHLTDEMKLTGGGEVLAGPFQIPGTDLDSHWIPFWVDMRKSGRIIAGTGATLLVNFTATDGEVITPFFMFSVTAKEEHIIYCDKKASCYDNVNHHWPLDKITNNMVYDVRSQLFSKISGSVTMNMAGPPLKFGNRTSLLLSNGGVYLHTPTSCLYAVLFCAEGFSFALWLKIESIKDTSQSYYLTGGEGGQGFLIFSPFAADRMDSNNVLEIVFQSGSIQWRVSVPFSLQTWHSVACSWHPSDGLLCFIDLSTVLKGKIRAAKSTFGSLTLGESRTIPNSFAHASVSSLTIWERQLTSSEFQSMYSCMKIMPRYESGSSVGIDSFRLPDESFTASSYTEDGRPYFARMSLGGWISGISDANQYLQIDFLVVMEVNRVEIKGNADLNAFVKKFKLAESKNGMTWITVKADTGADKIYTGNSNSSSAVARNIGRWMVTRWVRLLPITFENKVALSLEMFGKTNYANNLGCFPKTSLTTTPYPVELGTDPFKCIFGCGQLNLPYALLTNGGQCLCGSGIAIAEKLADDLCNVPCRDKVMLTCGGNAFYAVYQVTNYDNATFHISAPTWTKENTPTTFAFTANDGTVFELYRKHASLSTTLSQLELTFEHLDLEVVLIQAKVSTGLYAKTIGVQHTILVSTESKSLSLECPDLVVANQVYECVLSGFTGPNDVFKYTLDNNEIDTRLLPKGFTGTLGSLQYKISNEVRAKSGLYLVFSFVEKMAIVSSIKARVEETGVLSIVILRPVCGSGVLREYCDINNTCTLFHPICDLSGYQCSENKMLHLPSGQCFDKGNYECIGTTTQSKFIPLKYHKYEVVFVKELDLKNVGEQEFLGEGETIDVREHDVLGVYYPSVGAAKLTVESYDGYEGLDETTASGSLVKGGYIEASKENVKFVHMRHSLKAHYYVPQREIIPISLPPGVHHVALSLQKNGFQLTEEIISSRPIQDATWMLEAIVATNDVYTITVSATTGTNITYVVHYDDGAVDTFFQTNASELVTFTHVYTSPGYKSIRLRAYNHLSDESSNHMLLVQDYIKDVNLTSPVKPARLTHNTSIDWYIDSGSRVTIEIDLGDGTTFLEENVDIDGVRERLIPHVYPRPIEYWVNITAYNLVNRIELYFMLIIEIPIVDLNSTVTHANRDIEVNETVEIKLTQLNGTNVIHYLEFKDGSSLLTRETSILKNYSYWQVFPVNITAWNNVSWVAWTQPIKVHKPVIELTGFKIATSPTNHTDAVKFDFDMKTGSDFNCTWNFDDGLFGKSNYWITDQQVYKWPITHQEIFHKYAGIGVYNVRINCTNRLYSATASTISIVQVPVLGFELDQPPPQPNDEDLVVNFRAATGTNISYTVTFYHIWEKRNIEITDVTISPDTLNGTAVIDKRYFTDRVGLYDVKVTAINLVTPLQTLTRTVIVDRPIRDPKIVIHAEFVETNVTVNYTIFADASNVTIEWDFNDPHAGDLNRRSKWFQGVFSADGWTVWHKFDHSGFYVIEVTLSNSLGTKIVTERVKGEYGVYLLHVTDSPRPLPPGRLNFTFFPIPERYFWHPTDAQMVMNFGDGKNYTGPYNSTVIHFYEGWGLFEVNCTISNEISWGFFTFEVEIQRIIQGLKLTPFHSDGDAGYFGPAAGLNHDRLPLEYDVIWNVTTFDGTNITYTYDFGDGEGETTQNATVFHKYNAVDYYTATVWAENAVSKSSTTFTIRIQQIVIGVDITSNCPRKFGTPTTFRVTIEQVGTESCYLIKFGNNSLNYLYRDNRSTICEEEFVALANHTGEVFKENPFEFNYTYGFIDVYFPRLIGSNLVSKTWKFHKSVVVWNHCDYPKVDVFNIGKNVTTATHVLRSQVFMVDTQNIVKCEASKTTSFLWEVFEVNLDGGNDTLYDLPPSVATNNPRFRIDPRVLPYGLYKMRFTITMLGIDGVDGFDDGYLLIVESPLIATVNGGTGVAKGYKQNTTLDASASQDPDVGPGSYENITLSWECFAENVPQGTTELQAGCSVNRFKVLHNGSASDLVYLNTNFTLLPDINYALRLTIVKHHRRMRMHFNLHTKKENLVPVYVKCLQNCKKKRISAVKLAYRGGLRDVTDPEVLKRVKYKWKLYEAREPGRIRRIAEDEWKPVGNFEEEMVLTSTTTDTVVIGEKMLFPTSRYRIRLYVTLDDMEGFGEDELFINQPPNGGECSIEPSEGYALDTEFRVACSGWMDQDLPLSYKFAYKTTEEDFEQLIYFGSKSETPPVKLPLGKPHLNYSVSVIVDAADSFLAPEVVILNVTVTAKPITTMAEFEIQMMYMISQEGPLGNMVASGDAHSATQLIGSLSSLLDNLASNTSSSPNQDEINDLRSIDTEKMAPEEIEVIEMKIKGLEEAERIRKANETLIRVKMRKIMEDTVASIPIDSVEAIREKATASASLSNTPGEVTAEMQDSAMNAANEMIMFLGNSTMSGEPPNPQDTYNAAGGLISTLGNSMEASIETGSNYNKSEDGADGNTTKVDSASKGLVTKAMENVENLASAVLTQKFAGEPPTEVKTERLSMAVQRADPSSSGKIGASTGGGDFMMPNVGSLFGIEGNDTTGIPPVDTKAVSNSKNPFAWDSTSSKVKSKVMTMELKNSTGHPIKVSNLSKPIDMWVPRGLSVNFSLYTAKHKKMLYRAFPVVENDTSIQVEILAEDNNTELVAYLRYGNFPTEEFHDFKYVLPRRVFPVEPTGNMSQSNKTNTREINPFILFRSNEDLNRTAAGKYYIGVKYNGTYDPMYEAILSGEKLKYKEYIPENANFTMRTFTSSCLYWSIENDTWKSDGCVVGPKTAMEGTQCLCTHLTSFGGDMVVAPNTIDWSAISLDNLLSNPVVFAVVMSFILLYFILLIPARRQDKKDLEKLGVIPLPDNDTRDQYSYEITVYTGFTAEAGTTADVYFILKGTLDETPVRLLKDPSKNRMSIGSINYFLLNVPSSLGKLKSLRIWHDNGGSSPSWYLLRLMVHDVQRDTKTWFLCNRWLAVEHFDGEIERVLRPADADDLTKFNLLFQNEARKNLSDGHIWFSVVKRPARSNFTRVQRLSCCLCILLTTMLANAMFYQNDPSSSGDGVLKVGPFSFSLQQLSIAITSSLVVLPVNLFVVWIFRNAQPKKTEKEKRKEEEAEYNAKKKAKKNTKANPKKDEEKAPKKKSSLPHWWVYIAYFCIFIACAVSATFTVFYGLTFGKAKSEAWISAMMISFWQDVLISQPLKVFAAATVFALLTKDPKKATGENEEDSLPSPELKEDEEYTGQNMAGRGLVSMARIDPKPPDPKKLQESRELKLKQKKMKYIIYDIVWYFIFVTVLLSVAHGNKDQVAYGTTSTMSNFFEGGTYTNWIEPSEITDAKLYWYWSRYSLLPTLMPSQWYGPNLVLENVVWVKSDPQISRSRGARSRLNMNKNKIRQLQGRPGEFPDMTIVLNNTEPYPENFVADRATDYTVGVARFRQLRVKPNQCTIHQAFRHLFDECNSFYSWEKEDEGQYLKGWQKNIEENVNDNDTATEKQKNAWEYNTAWELKGTPYWAGFSTYWGGGFVADLGHNESLAMNMTAYLQDNDWLDRYTRAIFLEFTTYNPNVNMFCIVTLLSEIIPTGAYYQFNKVYPLRLYRYYGPNLLAIMVLEIVLMAFLLYFAYREFKKWRREGRQYWKDFWTYMELLVLASCFSTIGLYFARMVATNYSVGLMRDDPESFVSFHYAAALDQWSSFTLGMAVFLSFLKILRLLRFNRRMSFMGKTLKICFKPLASFFLVYMLVFLAYSSFGFLVFGKTATDYHTFQSSMANVLGMSLGAFNFHALVEAHNVLGPIFFFTFTFVVNFILINVFVAIISEALNAVTSDVANQSNEHEMLDFMIHQFMSYIGHRVSPAIKPVYVEPLQGVEESFAQIEKKTEGVEMAFRNLCMEEIRHTSWFDPEKCANKKKLLIRLLLQVDEHLTESEICDAIPLFDEVIRSYSEKDFKNWITEYGEDFDDTKTIRSSVLFSRATLYDSDDSSSGEDSDASIEEGRWSQLSGSTATSFDESRLFSGRSDIDAKLGSAQAYYNERPPSTAERFCRPDSAISMTSLNDNLAFVNQLLERDGSQRLFIKVDEDDDQESEKEEEFSDVEEELSQMESRPQSEESQSALSSMSSNVVTPSPSQMESRSSIDVRQPSPRNEMSLFQKSLNMSPKSTRSHEHNITVEEISD